MKHFFYFLLFVLVLGDAANAQQFLNGSVEPISSFSGFCTNISASSFNSNMPNASVTDPAGKPAFIGDSICVYAKVPAGIAFVGLLYDSASGLGQRLSLKLASPMVIGKKYIFSFAMIGTSSALGSPIIYGYMNDSTGNTDYSSTDTIAGPTTFTAWLTVTDSFVAGNNDQYFYVEVKAPLRGDGFNYFDNFKILNPATGVDEVYIPLHVVAYPNPCTNSTQITIDDNAVMPCEIVVTDLLGHIVIQKKVTETKVLLNLSEYAKGPYFLQLTDHNHNRSTIPLITQ